MDSLSAAIQLLKLCNLYVYGYGWAYNCIPMETAPHPEHAGNLFAPGAPGADFAEEFTSVAGYCEGVNVWRSVRLSIESAYIWAEPALKEAGWHGDIPLAAYAGGPYGDEEVEGPYEALNCRLNYIPRSPNTTSDMAELIFGEMRAELKALTRCVDAIRRAAMRSKVAIGPAAVQPKLGNASTGLITIKQMASISGISRRQLDAKSDDRPKPTSMPGGSSPHKYDYRNLRQWVLRHFPDRAFSLPDDFEMLGKFRTVELLVGTSI
jgi:hypothetical protein